MAKRKPYLKVGDPDRYRITRVKGHKKKNLHIFDKVKKVQISYERFEKIFELSESELFHLKSDEVSKIQKGKKHLTETGRVNITEYFKFFNKNRNFNFYCDINNLDELRRYTVKYAGKKMSVDALQEKIYYYLEHIERVYYLIKLKVSVINGSAHVVLRYEIINHQWDDVNSYTDKDGNFVLWNTQ